MTQFLERLLARCNAYRQTACLTLTTIHPDGQHRTPSRHIPLDRPGLQHEALTDLLAANAQGWGAFVAVGLRRRGLTRFRRGAEADLLALSALFVDVDDPAPETLRRLRAIQPEPSCISFTGGGFHAYWWLDVPLADMQLARRLLRGLQREAKGDSLSVAQSLRLVGTRNTKQDRQGAMCWIVELHPRYYPLSAFEPLLPRPPAPPPVVQSYRPTAHRASNSQLNPTLLRAVSDWLIGMGYAQRGDWLSGPCLYPAHHQHDDVHHSFGFNTRSGYGNCYRCGSILLKDVCQSLGVRIADYGGIYRNT